MRVEKQVQETQEKQEQRRQEVGYDLHVAMCWHYFVPFLARRNPDRNSAARRSRKECFKNSIILLHMVLSIHCFIYMVCLQGGELGNERVSEVDIERSIMYLMLMQKQPRPFQNDAPLRVLAP